MTRVNSTVVFTVEVRYFLIRKEGRREKRREGGREEKKERME